MLKIILEQFELEEFALSSSFDVMREAATRAEVLLLHYKRTVRIDPPIPPSAQLMPLLLANRFGCIRNESGTLVPFIPDGPMRLVFSFLFGSAREFCYARAIDAHHAFRIVWSDMFA